MNEMLAPYVWPMRGIVAVIILWLIAFFIKNHLDLRSKSASDRSVAKIYLAIFYLGGTGTVVCVILKHLGLPMFQ